MLSSEVKFQVPENSINYIGKSYKIEGVLGKGSFGIVLSCKKGNLKYAIKVLHKIPEFYELGLLEIAILKKLSHPNIVQYIHHFVHKGHLAIVFELLGLSLFETLKARKYRGFSLAVISSISAQLFSALTYLKDKKLMHSDIKPENVIFVEQYSTRIKLIDFGSATLEPKYNYIQSRYYRSPEVMLGVPYGPEMDMYSCGVMFAELFTGKPLLPGACEHSQFLLLTKLLGKPPQYILHASHSNKLDLFVDSFGNPRPCETKRGMVEGCCSIKGIGEVRVILGRLLNLKENDHFIELLSLCITWDPIQRISPSAASNSKFCKGSKSTFLCS